MKGPSGVLVLVLAIALAGAGFGAATSVVNDASSPYGLIGSRIADTGWSGAAEVASRLIGLGWAWAGLATVVGWLVATSARGAAAGVLSLVAATTAYYCMDSALRQEPLALYWTEMLQWWIASVVLGSALGVVGASIRRPGVVGLLAGLTLPIGATVQAISLPSRTILITPAMNGARIIVWVAAAAAAGVVVIRFIVARLGRDKLALRDVTDDDHLEQHTGTR